MRGLKNKKELLIVIAPVVALLAIVAGIILYRREQKFDYGSNMKETVITIGDTAIKLDEMMYYIYMVEATGQRAALEYDEKHPKKYWNMYMNKEFEDSGFVTDIAKKTAIDYCIRDNIYYMEAVQENFDISEAEREEIIYDAGELYEKSARYKNLQYVDKEVLQEVMLKEAVAHAYMRSLAGEDSVALKNMTEQVDIGGSLYRQRVQQYKIEKNESLLEKVRVGFVTVN